MKIRLEKIKNRPQVLLSLSATVLFTFILVVMINFYNHQSKKVLYAHVSEQLTTINNIKMHALTFFLNFRKSDIRALALSETIINLSDNLVNLDQQYHLKKSVSDAHTKYKNTSEVYRKYNPYLHSFLKEYMYTDIMLMDCDKGEILFSLNYQQYIGKNLHSKHFENSQMQKVWQKVIDTKQTHYSDMHTPLLYTDEPVMLIATPVYKEGKIISILMLKLPSNLINRVLNFRRSTLKTSETYAVGIDYLLRSDSFLVKDLTVKSSFNYPKTHFIQTNSVLKALNGKKGVGLQKDYRNKDVFSAYAPFEFDGIRWAVISEVDEIEIAQELNGIQDNFYIWVFILSIILFIIGYFVIRKIINISVVRPMVEIYNKAIGFETIINNSLNEIYICSKNKLFFEYANYAAIKNCGFALQELEEMKPYELQGEYNEETFFKLIKPLICAEVPIQEFETTHMRKDGSIYNVRVSLQIFEIDGQEKLVAIVNDITDHKKAIQEKDYYYYLSTHDYLTQQFNRQMFDKLFDNEVERCQRYGYSLSLIIIDLDNFKKVNDVYGHTVGDNVLKIVSADIKNLLRKSDIFARWGGEEFVICMPHAHLKQAVQKAEILRKAIEALVIDTVGSITCSFGVSELIDHDKIGEVFLQADEALYKAKENGRNRVESYPMI